MTTSPYQLAEDVFFCVSNRRLIFLDLRQNQYLCLNERNTQTAISLLTHSAEPKTKPAKEICPDDRAVDVESVQAIVQALSHRGLLTEDSTNGREAIPLHLRIPEKTLSDTRGTPRPTVSVGHCVVFFQAALSASWKLRRHSMQRIVQGVDNRKRRYSKEQIPDYDTLRELVGVFHHLRPYYVRKYLCLYDSLALIEFLAHYRLFPTWVFGVTAEPFGAHCWVQGKDRILNDTTDYVRTFTPIMAV